MSNKKDEWGNISLPGLSDQDLYETNWNMVAHAQTKRNNPEFSQRMSQVAHQRNTDPAYVESQLHGVRHKRDNTYQAECNSRPEVRAKISTAMQARTKSQQHQDRVAEQNRLRSKTIQTPYGQFASRRLAVEFMLAQGVVNASRKLDKWLKTQPTEYYYI